MKLQKLYSVLLGLALFAPQISLNAKIPTPTLGSTSWSKAILGSLAWLGAAPVKAPYKALGFCCQHYLITLAALGAGYWGYRNYFIPWNTKRNEEIRKDSEIQAQVVNTISKNPIGFQSTIAENPQFVSRLQNVLNSNSISERFCSWMPTKMHTWFHDRFGLVRGRSAQYFFDAALKAHEMTIYCNVKTKLVEDKSETDDFSNHQLNVLRTLCYSNRPEDAVSKAYMTRAGSALGQKVFGKNQVSINLPLAGAPAQQA